MSDNSKLNNSAHQNPSTVTPSINLSANKMMRALITKRKRPSVMMVTGKVSMISKGFIMAFSTANIKANMSASFNSGICTPVKKRESPNATRAVITNRMMKLMMNVL